MKRVYIAGPMSGLPQLNFPAFHAAAAHVRAMGLEAINPAEINPDTTASWSDCMRADIAQLVTCDAILLLPGWEKSRGATLEHHIAQTLGMRIETMSGFVPQPEAALTGSAPASRRFMSPAAV